MADTKQLIIQRAVTKAYITLINIFADGLDIVRSDIHELNIKLKSLNDLQRKYEIIQFELQIADEVGFDGESDRVQVEDGLYSVKCMLHNLIGIFTYNSNYISYAYAKQITNESVARYTQLELITIP